MRIMTLAVVVAVLMTASQAAAGTSFKAIVVGPEDSYPIPVILRDQTGLVTAIESARGDWRDAPFPNVRPDTDDPNAAVVTWFTGACDDDATISFQRSGAGFRLDVEIHEGFDFGCTAQLLIRALRMRFSEPIPADSITAHGGR